MSLLLNAVILTDNYRNSRLFRINLLDPSQDVHVELSPSDFLLNILFLLNDEKESIT